MPDRRNRLCIGIPGYGTVQFRWLSEWLNFQSEIARGGNLAGLIAAEIAYIDAAMNAIIRKALESKDWDYLVSIEHDMILPKGYVERLSTLDPETEKIVGCLYFGRAQEDMRPIPGYLREDGSFDRLDYGQVKQMLDNPGLYPVHVVGMGATAIHRSVLEEWDLDKMDWFKSRNMRGFLGHDVSFCKEAAEQGHTIWCDSTMIARHLGTWISDEKTYLATHEHHMRQADAPRKLEVLAGK